MFIFVVQIQRVQNYRQYTWQIIPKTGNSANFRMISFPMIFLCKVSEMGSHMMSHTLSTLYYIIRYSAMCMSLSPRMVCIYCKEEFVALQGPRQTQSFFPMFLKNTYSYVPAFWLLTVSSLILGILESSNH
jgi:hypothetical protein